MVSMFYVHSCVPQICQSGRMEKTGYGGTFGERGFTARPTSQSLDHMGC